MNPRARGALFGVGAVGLGLSLLAAVRGLPAMDQGHSAYGDAVNATTVPLRQTVNAVAAVTFDYRGFDTLGEEFILFAAVMGVTLLLRERRTEEDSGLRGGMRVGAEPPGTTDALRVWTLAQVAPGLLLGLYVVVHGHLSPGGGFQGGVVLAGAAALVFLAGASWRTRRLNPMALLDGLEGLGVAGFAGVGLLGMLLAGQEFLRNVLPLGTRGELPSAGQVPLLNGFVGLAVSAGIILILAELLDQTLVDRRKGDA
ncbi:MnhB domain-containing protein [Melittangium boletus]|uniref:Sodium:proton antiporter n=1 Tax=Melittangium boletus DSM 14713 TaxID=1294270 RepID=A0A250IEJ7_9BACT|nr:MnhB domain-containing protein [Melittangium boletus]ATB29668.1 sodium:proton antiporter [Melittangium boletus DSM 14713]